LSFAHGRAGVAYALIKLYEASGQQRLNIAGLSWRSASLPTLIRLAGTQVWARPITLEPPPPNLPGATANRAWRWR
jgi:hypothetical protein